MKNLFLSNNTKQSNLTAWYYKFVILIIFTFLNLYSIYGQTSLKLLSNKNKTLMTIKENTRSKVKYFNNAEIEKVKGKLIILNDSQIMLDSINKIGKISFVKQYLGHGAAVQGIGITGLGSYFMYKFFTFDQIQGQGKVFKAILYAMAGTTLITIGPPLTIAGEYIAHGSMRKTKKKNRRLIVQ